MNRKEELMEMTVAELRKMAPSLGVKNCRQYKKPELVEQILKAEGGNDSIEVEEVSSEVSDIDVPEVYGDASEETVVIDVERKVPYIEQAEIGTMVAFILPNGKVKSAKLINRSVKNRKIKVETSYGKQFVVPYDNVIWVRTNDRWPRGVYNMLKGNVATEVRRHG